MIFCSKLCLTFDDKYMEFKILFYVVGLIIYLVVSARKAAKKRQDAQSRSNPDVNPTPEKKSWEEELQEILKRNLEGQSKEKTILYEEEEVKPAPVPKRKYEQAIDHVPEVSARSSYEAQKEFDWSEHLNQESYSVETDDTPLETHIQELEAAMQKKEEPASVGKEILEEEGFDARKAFIYSEIFRAKYVEEGI